MHAYRHCLAGVAEEINLGVVCGSVRGEEINLGVVCGRNQPWCGRWNLGVDGGERNQPWCGVRVTVGREINLGAVCGCGVRVRRVRCAGEINLGAGETKSTLVR